MISGKVRYLENNGYERVVEITTDGADGVVDLKAHMLLPQEYLEPDESSELLKVGESYNFEAKISLVNRYSFHDDVEVLEFKQPIERSPAIVAKGKVVRIVDDDEVVLQIPGLDKEVLVEFEEDILARVGLVIVIQGQLELELIG